MSSLSDKSPTTITEFCGTYSGWNKHKRRNELPCPECKAARRAYDAEYSRNNSELVKSRRRASYEANRDRELSQAKEWRANNKATHAARVKEWFDRNPGYRKEYYWKDVELSREIGRRDASRRRARIADNGWEKYSEDEVISTYGVTCHLCGVEIDLTAPRKVGLENWEMGMHIDHLTPIAKGGPDTLENVRPAHGLCNVKKKDKEGVAP